MEDTAADHVILRRIKELQGWTLNALVAKRDELGLKMDPTRTYNLPEEIAREEVRRIEHPGDAVPGEVLQDTANTKYIKGELGPDFRPDQQLRVEMYDYLAERFGVETVNALEFHWGGHHNLNIGAELDSDEYPAADVAGFPFKDVDNRRHPGDGNPPPYNIQTSSGYFIYEVILPEFLRHFFAKNAEYGENHREGLGVRAEFVGLHRKVRKLQKAIWDGEELAFEQPQELLWDLIGSCLLMLDLMAQDEIYR